MQQQNAECGVTVTEKVRCRQTTRCKGYDQVDGEIQRPSLADKRSGQESYHSGIEALLEDGASGSRVTVSVREREVNGTVHQSVLLAASYSAPDPDSTPAPDSPLILMWDLYPNTTPFVKLTRSQCRPDRPGYHCSDHLAISPSHTGRVHLYPDNGSLLLWDLRRSDSGVYVISVYSGGDNTVQDNVTLTVYNETESAGPTSPPVTTPHHTGPSAHTMLTVGPICLVIILVTVCLSLLWTRTHRGCHRLDTTERIVQSNGVSREDLNENKEQNSQYETVYSTLQFPLDNSPTTTCGPDAHVIYTAPRKVQ
ncbi:uncharacterized protein LOC127586104 [Pristis pectinata]|uniref:uncharacterized protein LOC127586104 n=1 Tax=Pristis pectinata TaxID=685728 RepID=UPI00223D4276|nr:uncharacterized protein LOC127586104 [Pristis pectinata]